MERYNGLQAVWGSGEGHGEGWVAYGAAIVRDGVLLDLRASICRVLGVGTYPSAGVAAWDARVRTLTDNAVPCEDRAWVEWFPAIAKGIGRWVLVGGAAAERRDTIAAGKARAAAVKRAGRARWWARLKEERLRLRAAAAALKERVRVGPRRC